MVLARQAVITEPFKTTIREVEIPDPSPNQILIAAEYSAISAGTEPAVYTGTHQWLRDSNLPDWKFPFRSGYSAAGRVLKPLSTMRKDPTMLSRVLVVLVLASVVGGCQPPMEDFTSTEFKFKVRFPGKPKEEQQAGPLGTTMKMFSVETRDGVAGVAVADLPLPENMPQAQIDGALDGAQAGVIRSGNGKLKESKKITVGEKYPGREFSATIAQPRSGQVRSKIFLVGNRLYQVMVMGTDSFATSAEANEFLNSFQLLK